MADINDLKTAPMKEPMKIVDPNVVASRRKPIKATKKSNAQTSVRRTRRKWEDDIQPYGRDTRDDDEDDFLPRKQSSPKNKPHGKYNINNKKSKRH